MAIFYSYVTNYQLFPMAIFYSYVKLQTISMAIFYI